MKRMFPVIFYATLSMLAVVACHMVPKSEPEAVGATLDTLNAIDQRIISYKPWSKLAPSQQDMDRSISGKQTKVEGGYQCEEEKFSLTQTPKEVVLFDANSAALWPGALWQGGPYIDYQIEQLPLPHRAKVTLSTDLPIANPNVDVVPSLAGMRQGVETLRGRASAEGKRVGARAIYDAREAYSVEQFSLNLGLSAKFANQSVAAALDWKQSVETRTIAAYFVQKMFSVFIPPPTTPSEFFDGLTPDDIETQETLGKMGPDNPPLYVESVTYGRLLYFTFTSTASYSDMKAALDYGYHGGADVDAKAKAAYEKTLSSSQIHVVPYGGPYEDAERLIKSAKIGDYFNEKDAPLSTAVPISYRLNTLARGKPAAVAETTEYTQRNCHLAMKSVVKKDGKFHLQYLGDNRYVSIAEWKKPADQSKRPYPTLQQRPITMQFRGNSDELMHGNQIRFATLEKKAQGEKLGRMFEPGAWTWKSRVFYDTPQKGAKQDWVILKSCIVKKKKCDKKIRYGDSIHIRSIYKPDEYLCNEHKSHYLNTAKATCTWALKAP